jgi:hypothetical protein
VSFRHELQADGQILLRITRSPARDAEGYYIPEDAIPWFKFKNRLRVSKVWGDANKKMACPVFDLPAGGTLVGGTCPGANEGQSIVPETHRRGMLSSTGQRVDLPKAICESCVTGDTLVMVRGEGLRRIDELLGREFEVWSGIDWRRTRVVERGLKPTLVVRTANGIEIRATADHQFLTSDGWVEAEQLEPGDALPKPTQPEGVEEAVSGGHFRVSSVVPSGRIEAVYDLLNVGDEHQFVANGLVIHNCYAEGGPIAYSSNQMKQTLNYIWASAMTSKYYDDFVDLMTESILRMPDSEFGYAPGVAPPPGNILPIRLHASGDFFNFRYAGAWIDIANRLAESERGRRVRIWAPTRTWAVRGWPEWWRENLSRLRTPNLMVRPSAYHFDEAPPPRLHPDNAEGSTSFFVKADRVEEEKSRTDFWARPDEKPYFDWMCPAYSLRAGDEASCTNSPNPMGGVHCRACWIRPDLRVNYAAH